MAEGPSIPLLEESLRQVEGELVRCRMSLFDAVKERKAAEARCATLKAALERVDVGLQQILDVPMPPKVAAVVGTLSAVVAAALQEETP